MQFSFELNTIATVGAEIARKATKRKRNSTAKDPGPVKQQKFNNGLPFTANSPSQCHRERNALIEEEISEQQAPKHDSDLTKTSSSQSSSSQAKRKRLSTVEDQAPSKQQKFNNGLPFTTDSPSQCHRERTALIEEDIFGQQAPKHDSDLTTTPPSRASLSPASSSQAPKHDSDLTTEPPSQASLSPASSSQAPKYDSDLTTEPPSQASSSQVPKHDSASTTTPPSQASPSQAPKHDFASTTTPPSQASPSQAPKHDSDLTTTPPSQASLSPASSSPASSSPASSSQAKRKRLSTIEDQAPRKQQKLNDSSALCTSPQSNISLQFLADAALSNSTSRSSISSNLTSGTSTPANASSSNSTSRSSTPARTERRKGGRPRADKQFPRQKQLRVRTKLRTNRPVQNKIPCEIWQSILEYCPSEFLLKAVTIDYFNEILRRNENSWKVARLRQFGHDMPDPPPGISEPEYAEILTGSGCQGCHDKLTRRAYWGFQKRWCDSCLVENVAPVKILEKEYAERCERDPGKGNFSLKLVQCIPGVRYDSWNHYQWVGDYEVAPSWAKTYANGQNLRFSRSSFKEMETKVRESRLNSSSTEEEIEAFFEPHITENNAFVSRLQAIEGWWMTFRQEKRNEVAALKENRATNFKARALSMDPPLSSEALELCPSYQRARNISGPFTDKVWSVLKSKLVVERDAAEAQLAKILWLEDINKYRQQMRGDQAENTLRRENNSSPEQLFVLGLADAVIADLEAILMRGAISPEDLIHVFFRQVYDAYESSPMKPQGKNGDYRLIMDDARMVEKERFRPFLERHGLHWARKVKCPGCMNTHDTRSMTDQMQHIVEHHYTFDNRYNDDLHHMVHYPCYQNMFQWLYIEWPLNMPMLAPHDSATGSWNFRDRIDYRF